ncbi:MAG: flagellar FliJ family protein [Planctomycetes bacterium]|nr:flagellar FliJ family protein [Planctomycetota bacterium]
MRRFRFRLAPLLRLRSQLERNARRELAAAVAEVSVFDQRLAAVAQGLRDCADQAADRGAVGQLARGLETGLRRHQWRLRTEQGKAQKKLDVARAEFVVKTRELRTLRQLHDQRHEEWRDDARRAEQSEIDELASLGRHAQRHDAEQHGVDQA